MTEGNKLIRNEKELVELINNSNNKSITVSLLLRGGLSSTKTISVSTEEPKEYFVFNEIDDSEYICTETELGDKFNTAMNMGALVYLFDT